MRSHSYWSVSAKFHGTPPFSIVDGHPFEFLAPRNQNRTPPVTLPSTPPMPMNELLGILIAIIVIWVILKLAKVAIRLILFVIAVLLIAGALYYVFMR